MNKSTKIYSEKPFLTIEEFQDVLLDTNRSRFAIYVSSDFLLKVLTIWLGDMTIISVPFSDFEFVTGNSHPDFSKVSIIDHGQTIKLGDYEASMDAILKIKLRNVKESNGQNILPKDSKADYEWTLFEEDGYWSDGTCSFPDIGHIIPPTKGSKLVIRKFNKELC